MANIVLARKHVDKHTGYNAQRTGMETRGHTHTHTHTHTYETAIARLCAFDYRSMTSLSSIIEAPSSLLSFPSWFSAFPTVDVSLIEGLHGLISLYTGFGAATAQGSIVGVIVATRKGESPGNLVI